ncbi:MAG: phosphate ABC transporter permease PstA [Haloarculaceae archaeon]
MATDTGTGTFAGDRSLWWRRIKGRLFEGLLVTATLFGLVSLVTIFVLISWDALGPDAATPEWYLVYFGTLVGPVSAYTLYVRRRPAAKSVSAMSYVVVFGSLTTSLVVFAVVDAVRPHDVIVPLAFATLPPLAIIGYARVYGETHLTGPAIPVSIVVGLAASVFLHDTILSVIAILADWVVFVGIVTVPVAAMLGIVARRRWNDRVGLMTAGLVVGVALGAAVAGLSTGREPSLWVVLASGTVAPIGFFVADTLANRSEGQIGLFGPAILVGGVLLGASIERQYGIAGLDSWLNPTLLLDSWSTFRPEQAGIYPQVVGSIMIVGIMAFMSFPVGIGAAVYLEEYAPSSGWKGMLASTLDVNISNLAGVPSVVYGLLGLALFRQVFGLSPGIAVAAGATLGLLILPIVIVSSQEALRSVPDELRQASYGMGASRWQTVRNVVLPEAVPGILTGTILSLGRAIGETAPLVMIGVATTRFSPPEGLFSGATALPLQIFAAKGNNIPEYRVGVVAAAALVLLLLMLVMNATAILIRNKYQRK